MESALSQPKTVWLPRTTKHQGKSEGFDSCDRPSNLKLDSNRQFFSLCDLEIWWMTSKKNRALLLYYFKLCASFQIHRLIQTWVTVRKQSIRVKIGNILSRVTLKFDGCHWKTIWHLFYTTSSFVHHFKYIGEVKLELQSGNAQFGSISATFCPVWPWNLTDDLENNRAPLLCCFKLCASFHSHGWIQTGVTVWKRSIWVKIGNFLSHVTLKIDRWHWKTIGHLSYAASSFMHRSIAIGEFKLELQSGNAQFGSKSTIFLAVWPWNLTDDLENNRAPLLSNIKLCTSFHRHIWIQTEVTVRRLLNGVMISVTLTFDLWPWPFAWTSCLSMVITPENFRIRWQEHCQKGETDGRTDRQTDGRTDGRKEMFLELLGRS